MKVEDATRDELRQFSALLSAVRDEALEAVPPYWPELRDLVESALRPPLSPIAVLPLASCDAVGGDARHAVPVAAAGTMVSFFARVLDDLQDEDRPHALVDLSAARAHNFAAAVYTLSNGILSGARLPAARHRLLCRRFAQTELRMAFAQDADLLGDTTTIESYWRCITGKTAEAFALACEAGAIVGTDDALQIEACRTFGHHLGLALQLFDDLEGIWQPHGMSDLVRGKVTLPIIFALTVRHPAREELEHIVHGGSLPSNAEKVRAILDEIDARSFVVWAALQEREAALAALAPLPGRAGVHTLAAYVTTLFAHVEELLGGNNHPVAGSDAPGAGTEGEGG